MDSAKKIIIIQDSKVKLVSMETKEYILSEKVVETIEGLVKEKTKQLKPNTKVGTSRNTGVKT